MTEFKRETRYVVLKIKDIGELHTQDMKRLTRVCESIKKIRKRREKNDLRCVVVEHDWPEYEKVWEMIGQRMNKENCEKVNP